MDKLKALMNVSVLLATTEQRARWEYDPKHAEAAVRSMRRQVQRYGDEARDGFMRQGQTEEERAIIARALSNARVGTVVLEWIGRG